VSVLTKNLYLFSHRCAVGCSSDKTPSWDWWNLVKECRDGIIIVHCDSCRGSFDIGNGIHIAAPLDKLVPSSGSASKSTTVRSSYVKWASPGWTTKPPAVHEIARLYWVDEGCSGATVKFCSAAQVDRVYPASIITTLQI
jgi:hypothetical protein